MTAGVIILGSIDYGHSPSAIWAEPPRASPPIATGRIVDVDNSFDLPPLFAMTFELKIEGDVILSHHRFLNF